MPRLTTPQLTLIVSALSIPIGIIIADWYSAIPEYLYEITAELISYKRLLQLCLLLLFLIPCVVLYYRSRLIEHKSIDIPATITENNEINPLKQKEQQVELLRNLSKDEKNILQMSFALDTKQIFNPVFLDRPTAQALADKGMLFHPHGHVRDFYIEDWVWKLLKDNPKLLQG